MSLSMPHVFIHYNENIIIALKPCRALLTAMFNRQIPMYYQAIHVLLMHGFYTLHIHVRILGRHKNWRREQ